MASSLCGTLLIAFLSNAAGSLAPDGDMLNLMQQRVAMHEAMHETGKQTAPLWYYLAQKERERGDVTVSDDDWNVMARAKHLTLHVDTKKLMFCLIPKIASTEFLMLMMRLDGMSWDHWNPAKIDQGQYWVHSDADREHMFFDYGKDGEKERFASIVDGGVHAAPLNVSPKHEAGWTKAVFLRDPVARLISAFLSKVQTGYYENADPAYSKDLSFTAFVDQLEANGVSAATEPHLCPQSYLCDLQNTIDHYDVVGDFDNLDADAHKMVAKLGGDQLANEMLDNGWGHAEDKALFGVSREERDGSLGMPTTGSDSNDIANLTTSLYAERKSYGDAFGRSTDMYAQNHQQEDVYVRALLDKIDGTPEVLAKIKALYQMDYDLMKRAGLDK